jgi:phosphoglucosamine mutase
MTVYPQVLLAVAVSSKPDLRTLPAVRQAMDAVTAELGDQGRILVRYSGTQSVCRVMVEGPTMDRTQSCCQRIAEAVRQAIGA